MRLKKRSPLRRSRRAPVSPQEKNKALIAVWFRREGDPELPPGEKSRFSSSSDAVDAVFDAVDRIEAGFLEAHIALFFQLHEARYWDQIAKAYEAQELSEYAGELSGKEGA